MFNKIFGKRLISVDKIISEFSNEFHSEKSKTLRQDYKHWKNTLSKEEIFVLKKYRLGMIIPGKRNINAYLRSNSFTDEAKNNEITILKGALSKAHLKESIATYRTISKNEYTFLKQFKINDEFENKDFKGSHVAKYIYKNTTAAYVIYLIPNRYSCAYINYWIPIFMHEKELLLNCGSQCKIIDIKKVFHKDCYILKITER